jgi:dCMP deaminase
MKRITRDKLHTEIAKLFSQRSTCGRLQVGCVITRDGRVIASGYNGPLAPAYKKVKDSNQMCKCNLIEPCGISIHAEANAIAYSARNGISLDGTTIYCTHNPCLKCSELIIQAGIIRVVFVEHFRDANGIQLLIANEIEVTKYDATE